MAHYYFHVINDVETRDPEGADFTDMASAIARATQEARILAAESVKLHGHLVLSHCIRIEQADGHAVAQIQFGDAVEIRP